MIIIYWDARYIIVIDYLIRGKTINSEYYANLLHLLKLQYSRFGQEENCVPPYHKSLIAMAKIY